MRMEVYSVYDKAIEAFMPPFFCRSRGEALRSFSTAVNDPNSQIGKFVADYALFWIGSFEDGSGELTCATAAGPVRIIQALECVEAVTLDHASRETSVLSK